MNNMPKRTPENLEKYKIACSNVLERANNMCEVLVDEDGKACTDKEKKRCGKYIQSESATFTNFLHKETRNGKSEDWVSNPDNIGLGCSSHHLEEEAVGIRVKFQEYEDGEVYYVEDIN